MLSSLLAIRESETPIQTKFTENSQCRINSRYDFARSRKENSEDDEFNMISISENGIHRNRK